jgi:(p)ppGpp synthase/HD superfamily hydrolase
MRSSLVGRAEQLARHAHQNQKKVGGAPYIVHPERVAQILAEAGFDDVTVAAGWLHDTLEDTETSAEEIAMLHPELLQVIQSVTEKSDLSWSERKKDFTDRIREASDRAKAVACADRVDNLTNFLADYQNVGAELWNKWPKRTPEQKLQSDEYFLDMLKSTWEHPLVDLLETLVVQESETIKSN